jgi:hypothetical protein
MKNERYAINKYYTMVFVDSNTKVLMERFMVVRILMDISGITFTEEICGDNFETYKNALDYIEVHLELRK